MPASTENRAVMSEKVADRDATHSAWLRAGFWISIVIAVAAVLRRVVAIAHPLQSGPPQMVGLDAFFASHATLTLAHVLIAMLFVLVTPFFVFGDPARTVWPERLLFPLGALVGLTAYEMSQYPVGGWTELSAVLFFNTLFLFSLFQSYRHWRRGEGALKRRWMIRAIAILLGIATTRPVMGIFFATSPFTHLGPGQFFGIAFWIGFSINTLGVELWFRSRDRKSLAAPISANPGG